MEENKTKREEIEQLLDSGKTAKEIAQYTGYDRSWIWSVRNMWLKKKEAGQ